MRPVDFGEEIELGTLLSVIGAFSQIGNTSVILLALAAADGGSLMGGRKEGAGPIANSTVTESGIDGDKAGQVLVFGAQAVADP